MQLYIKFFAMHLKSQMQYKLSFFLTILGQFFMSFTALLGLYFMFLRFNAVEDYTFEHVLLCFAVLLMAFSIAETFGRGFDLFPQMLGNGEFDRALVRPRNIVFQVLASKMDFTRLGRLIQAILVFCYAIPNSGVIWTWDKVLTLLFMIGCGSLIFFALFIVYAGFTFFTVEGLEFMNIFTDGGREFGRYPFSIYGKNILMFLTFVIPLALFQYYPLLYLLDREKSMFYMFTPIIGLLFIIPSYTFFRIGLRRYKSTGS
ncbi:MAG: ABC-2 family transporter protein [Bacillota bacterium]|jgi:ABC-2 type transport system permease protein|nr:ABC-2 family transporter protein [Bacillota bacterium]